MITINYYSLRFVWFCYFSVDDFNRFEHCKQNLFGNYFALDFAVSLFRWFKWRVECDNRTITRTWKCTDNRKYNLHKFRTTNTRQSALCSLHWTPLVHCTLHNSSTHACARDGGDPWSAFSSHNHTQPQKCTSINYFTPAFLPAFWATTKKFTIFPVFWLRFNRQFLGSLAFNARVCLC